jgi:hypothetical protein
VGLFKRVKARAIGRPGGAVTPLPVVAHEPASQPDPTPEHEWVSCSAALLVGGAEHSAWSGRARAFAGYGNRHASSVSHVGGAEGSAARSIPRDLPGPVRLTVTTRRFVVSAEPAPGAPPVQVAVFDRSVVRWVARTGRQDQAGVHVRISLADESFFDVAIPPGEVTRFLLVAAEFVN